ncbi:MAG TPA: hypothetical protein VFW88_06850 [Burkholderiales bacterium]|nr:hypothetical protein [Burkholderiales bacterium]
MTDNAFSRSPTPHPLGKCDTELKTQVPEQLSDDLKCLASLNDMTVSVYLRDLVTRHLYGDLGAARMVLRTAKGEGGNAP